MCSHKVVPRLLFLLSLSHLEKRKRYLLDIITHTTNVCLKDMGFMLIVALDIKHVAHSI
jgi:hypothetical protein